MKKREQFTQLGANARKSMGSDVEMEAAIPAWAPSKEDEQLEGVEKVKNVARVPVDKIVRDENQPRTEFDQDELERLAVSLKARGQIQPITLRWDPGRRVYVLIAGERRWRAAKLAGLPTLTAVLHDGAIDDAELLAIQLTENALRTDLQPIEQAKAYQRLMDARGWSMRDLAENLAIAHTSVAQAVRLLDLPEEVQDNVAKGDLPASTAYEVAKLETPEEQVEVAKEAIAGKLPRNQVRAAIQARRSQKASRGGTPIRRTEFKMDGFTFTAQGPIDDTRALWAAWRKVLEAHGEASAA